MNAFYTFFSILFIANCSFAQQANQVKTTAFTPTDTTFQQTGETAISGIISDMDYPENLPFATAILSKDGVFVAGMHTDFEGLYAFKNVEEGIYNLDITYVGYTPQKITDVVVKNGQMTKVSVAMSSDVSLDMPNVGYHIPLIGGELTANRVNLTRLSGTVIEEETGDPVIYGSVALYKNDILQTGVETDWDGQYIFENLEAGVYDVEVSYVGFPSMRFSDIEVKVGQTTKFDVKLEHGGHILSCPVGVGYRIPLYEQDNFTSGQTFSSAEIKRRPIPRN